MPAPPLPVQELDPGDLVAEPEERSTSQTRRMGSHAHAALELELRKSKPGLDVPTAPAADAPAADAPVALVDLAQPVSPDAPLAKPYLAGDVIAGKYKLTRIIGKGGMGAVWRAHNIPLDIDVAIKLIRRDRTAPGAAERLLTEARAAARLMHPSIVRVFDFGESEQGDPFIVMELLDGESLSAILRRKKRLTPAVAVQTMLPVAAALASAHGKGIVHRDLKPDNIIIVTHENGALLPKIVDFGIAKLMSPDVERQVTMAGEVLGSPDYMSPEQARGAENVGEATDVWAFSVVLYELCTGVRPFDGPNYNSLIAAILTNEPAPITAHGVTDAALATLIQHGLQKDVPERWHTMREMGMALATWSVTNGIEDDVTGTSIAKQWLSGAMKRLLTVMPAGQQVFPATADARAGAPSLPAGAPPPVVETIVGGRRAAPRLVWIAPAIAIAAVIGTAGWFGRERIAQLVAPAAAGSAAPAASGTAEAAPSNTAAASAAPSASSTAEVAAHAGSAAPSASSTAEAAASAAPSGAASAAPTGSARALPWPKTPRKNKAPAAPKNIRF